MLIKRQSVRNPNSMHIFFAYENAGDSKDAVTVALLELREELEAGGYRATLLLPGWKRRNEVSSIRKIMNQILYVAALSWSLLRVRGKRVVLVTLDSPAGLGVIGALFAKLSPMRIRHISWVMDLYRFAEIAPLNGRMSRLLRWVDRRSLIHAGEIVTIGNCMADLIADNSGRRSTVIPIWQDIHKFYATREQTCRIREEMSLQGKFVVLYSGTARNLHPLDPLVEAAVALRDHANITFVVVGRGSEVEKLNRTVRKMSLRNVVFYDYRPAEDVGAVAAMADVHIVSLSEDATGTCVPSKGYAAMAAQRPLAFFGSVSCQLSQDIAVANCGSTFSQTEGSVFADFVLDLVKDPERAKQLGHNGFAFFSRHHTTKVGAASWKQHLENLRL